MQSLPHRFRAWWGLAGVALEVAVAVAAAGCFGPAQSHALPDANTTGNAPPAPIVIPNLGGPTLSSPTVYLVSFCGDNYGQALDAMLSWYLPNELPQQAGEYGVQAGTLANWYVVSSAPGATMQDSDIQTLLAGEIACGAFPAPTANTFYVVLTPPGTTVVKANGQQSCVDFNGYHHGASTTKGEVYYAEVANCPVGSDGLSVGDEITVTASHEVAETTTDPSTNNAWDKKGLPSEGEIGDLCHGLFFAANGFAVQRIYSDNAANAGQNPCVPANPGEPYFGFGPLTEAPLTIPAGGQVTIDTEAFSTAPLCAPINTSARVFSGVSVQVGAQTAVPGQHIPVTVSVPAGTPPGTGYGFETLATDGTYPDFTKFPIEVIVQ
jgi:hypothetical protein